MIKKNTSDIHSFSDITGAERNKWDFYIYASFKTRETYLGTRFRPYSKGYKFVHISKVIH